MTKFLENLEQYRAKNLRIESDKLMENRELFKELREDEQSRLYAAIWNFSSAFSSSQEYKDYETAYSRMNQDAAAQSDLVSYRQKQQDINQAFRQNGNREKALSELEKLEKDLLKNSVIADFIKAQEALMDLCTEAGKILSENLGLDYAAVCGPSCCG